MHEGSCLCGRVTFQISGEIPQPNACHCSQCRKQSGHYWASADVTREDLTIGGAENVMWYQASEKIRRGFCGCCGSFLFWDPLKGGKTAVAMGAINTPTGTKLGSHIFVADKGDYYEIADGLPQNQQ